MNIRNVSYALGMVVLFLVGFPVLAQQVSTQSLTLTPVPTSPNSYTDTFGNRFLVTPQGGGSLCSPDGAGCMVQVCDGSGHCQYYYCTVNKCVKVTAQGASIKEPTS